jgi:hypothetical protein
VLIVYTGCAGSHQLRPSHVDCKNFALGVNFIGIILFKLYEVILQDNINIRFFEVSLCQVLGFIC